MRVKILNFGIVACFKLDNQRVSSLLKLICYNLTLYFECL